MRTCVRPGAEGPRSRPAVVTSVTWRNLRRGPHRVGYRTYLSRHGRDSLMDLLDAFVRVVGSSAARQLRMTLVVCLASECREVDTCATPSREELDMSPALAAIHALVPAAAKTWIRIALSAVAIATATLGGFLAYHAGELHARQITVLSGNAYVGAGQAAVRVAGWTYSVSDGVTWIDGSGSLHETGWPGCLSTQGTTVPIKFGEIQVTAPNGDSWRQVVWVDCRS